MFLSSGENKESLSHFVAREWSSAKYCTKPHGLTLFVSHGHECHGISTANGLFFVTQTFIVNMQYYK